VSEPGRIALRPGAGFAGTGCLRVGRQSVVEPGWSDCKGLDHGSVRGNKITDYAAAFLRALQQGNRDCGAGVASLQRQQGSGRPAGPSSLPAESQAGDISLSARSTLATGSVRLQAGIR